jgi:signal transduction histidine kinase/ActR/RegA family two-component response regulator
MAADEVWRARLARERAARHEAERLLETKARELYLRNRELAEAAATLEARVAARTADLEAALAAADRAAQARLAFLAMVSHELRTPLNAIVGVIGLLGESTLDAAQRRQVALMEGSAAALLRIIDDIIDLARLESGKVAIEAQPFDAAALAKEAAETLRAEAEAKGLALTLDLAALGTPWMKSDAGRVRQVLLNLLGNAVKFTVRGGVRVIARRLPGPMLELEVADTGPGLLEEDQRRLFEPFVRAGRAGLDRLSGTGLGLAISKRILDALGGTITVDSTPGEGARFLVRVPVREAAAPPPAPQPVEATSVLPGRVLVVDDLPTNAIIAAEHLRRAGHAVDIASGGAEAIAAHEAAPYDVVVMDLLMPEMDGLAATRALRALPGPRPAILGLTAAGLDDVGAACREAGMQELLSKPVTGPQLRAAVARWLEDRQGRAA